MAKDFSMLVGVANPVDKLSGFAVPIFEKHDKLYVQNVSNKNRIRSFSEADLAEEEITRFKTPLRKSVGDEMVFGFYWNKSPIAGTKDEIARWLQDNIALFEGHPFLLVEIADFLEDLVLKNKAKIKALLKLQEEYPDGNLKARTMNLWADDAAVQGKPEQKSTLINIIQFADERKRKPTSARIISRRIVSRRPGRVDPGISTIRSDKSSTDKRHKRR